ncbi:hypothetical protein BV898_05984 [Hypsibius exemplaris]|uniref:Uncharacterized protein n=1 Tax=Hypsibius exemplaris TaxID=2072580 RepID=A0A1W0WXP5_HYPEX|nr:hypothetical protein BV898_05984 [Hypsibius exemplaris]
MHLSGYVVTILESSSEAASTNSRRRDENDLREQFLVHQDTPLGNSSGFFLSAVLRLGTDQQILFDALNDSLPGISGAECVAVHTAFGVDLELYQQLLQSFGGSLQDLLDAAANNTGAMYPGKYLKAVLKFGRDIGAIQVITETNDTSTACLVATRNIADDLTFILATQDAI